MEAVGEEFRDAAIGFMPRTAKEDAPFFMWFNAGHMHFRTHSEPESVGRAGRWQSEYHDTMLDHLWPMVPGQACATRMLQSLAGFPPRRPPATFSIDRVVTKLRSGASGT